MFCKIKILPKTLCCRLLIEPLTDGRVELGVVLGQPGADVGMDQVGDNVGVTATLLDTGVELRGQLNWQSSVHWSHGNLDTPEHCH